MAGRFLTLTVEQPLRPLAELAAELGDLKRIRDARSENSLASRLFLRAWQALMAGVDPARVADVITADAVASTRLGGLDSAMLAGVGLDDSAIRNVLRNGIMAVSATLDSATYQVLLDAVGSPLMQREAPDFVMDLIRQPRAGATCPGKPRIVLEPPEGHGDHCLIVAVLAALLAERMGSDRATPFLAGLMHHAHNAVLPDSGFAGEMLLGDHLQTIMIRLFSEAYTKLPEPLAAAAKDAMNHATHADTPAGRAFNAADVLDRVLQMRHYAMVADFTLDQAINDLELVHGGPLQHYHYTVLAEAGLQ